MAVLKICKYGEPILHRSLTEVDYAAAKDSLARIIEDMWETCLVMRGAGLAACQVGLDMRLVVIAVPQDDKSWRRLTLVNPVVTARTGRKVEEEGCLSLPGLFAEAVRAAKVTVRALNEKGIPVEITASGFLAKVMQHEIDHLDGHVFTERVVAAEKNRVKSEIRRLKKHWAGIDESKQVPDYENGFPWDA
ncbi:MAG: peptide deformylase [Elusimicrobiaceae bacterium]|nr:peptide deformylase [Elusimicrobiaceae bacterium]